MIIILERMEYHAYISILLLARAYFDKLRGV
jgi:hypothetical protein